MATLSVIVLGKNVAHEIVPTLKTCQFADETILVDTGSTDDTVKVSRPYVKKIIHTSPKQNFAKWRNLGAKEAKNDWLLYVDSDERVTVKLAQEIIDTINHPQHNAYSIPRWDIQLGKELKHWPHPRVMRLIKKTALVKWHGKLHEQPEINGTTGEINYHFVHLTHKNIVEKVTNTLNWSDIESDNLLKANHPQMVGWRFWRIILTEMFNRCIKQGLWKDGTEGHIEIIYQSFSRFITYVRLWEKQRHPSLQETYDNIDKKVLAEWKNKKI